MRPQRLGRLRIVVVLVSTGAWATACNKSDDMGVVDAVKGSMFGEAEVARVADLMARDLVRDPLFHQAGQPPRVALVRVENETTQYMFSEARNAYLVRLRTQLAQSLKERVIFVDPDIEWRIREVLVNWRPDDSSTAGVARGHKDKHGVDLFLTARFMSTDKVVAVPAKDGTMSNRRIVMLEMNFNLVDAETAELAWTQSFASAAAYSSRDFQN